MVHNTVFSQEETAKFVYRCRKERVTVQNVLFVACNLSWMRAVSNSNGRMAEATKRVFNGRIDWPTLMYTAVNLRSFLPPESRAVPPPPPGFAPLDTAVAFSMTEAVSQVPLGSEGTLGVGYCNVSLPTNDYPSSSSVSPYNSGRSRSEQSWFWNQARSVKSQITESDDDLYQVLARNMLLAKERCERSKAFARLDDERLHGRRAGTQPAYQTSVSSTTNTNPSSPPSTALVGLSLLGNLDPLYPPSAHPSIKLISTHCATRKGPGGLLIFSQTLMGKLGITFSWDREGFEKGVVEGFMNGVIDVLNEFVLSDGDESNLEVSQHMARL